MILAAIQNSNLQTVLRALYDWDRPGCAFVVSVGERESVGN